MRTRRAVSIQSIEIFGIALCSAETAGLHSLVAENALPVPAAPRHPVTLWASCYGWHLALLGSQIGLTFYQFAEGETEGIFLMDLLVTFRTIQPKTVELHLLGFDAADEG